MAQAIGEVIRLVLHPALHPAGRCPPAEDDGAGPLPAENVLGIPPTALDDQAPPLPDKDASPLGSSMMEAPSSARNGFIEREAGGEIHLPEPASASPRGRAAQPQPMAEGGMEPEG